MNDRKHREFWIGPSITGWTGYDSYKVFQIMHPNPSEAIRAIEYSAVTELLEALEEAITEYICMCYGETDLARRHRDPCVHCRNKESKIKILTKFREGKAKV